jgi:DNA-directed RNA polymerase III subunit RPC7
MAGMKDKKPDDKHARVLEKLFSVPVDEDAEEVDEDQEQDAGMYMLRLLQGLLLIS